MSKFRKDLGAPTPDRDKMDVGRAMSDLGKRQHSVLED